MLIRGEYVKNLTQSIKLCTTRAFCQICVRVENELSPQFYPLNPRNKCTGQHNILKDDQIRREEFENKKVGGRNHCAQV